MLKKFTNKKGFTLMEMLIVVAIIAVLVAIAIPTFSSALTKAKESADVANVRALYAEWQIAIMSDGKAIPTGSDDAAAKTEFLKGPGGTGSTTLYDDANLTVDKSNGTITYTADALTDANGSKEFKWTLKPIN